MALFQKRGKWYIDYRYQGRRIRECVGPSKRAAEQALAARRGEIVQGRFNLQTVKRSPRFEDVAADYKAWARANIRSSVRVAQHLTRLGGYFRGKTLREITPWLVEKYKRDRLQGTVHRRPIRPTTVNRELSCLRRLFNLAIQWGKTESNPVRGVKFFREDGRRERILSPEELQRLLAACTEHSRPFVLLALNTGMRLGEILSLTWEQVDLDRGVITLTRTKNGKVRKVPLNGWVQETLRSFPRSGSWVFGGEKPYGAIKTAWLAACRRAGIKSCRFHDLRHTWASYLVESGVDLRTVQELGGWSSLTLVERYSHPTSDAKWRAVEALGQFIAARDGHQMDTTAAPAVATRALSMRQ